MTGPQTVWIYVDSRKLVGDRGHLQVFADEDAAEEWFSENDPEGVAFEYPVNGTGAEKRPQPGTG
jgi:hypothetical protein